MFLSAAFLLSLGFCSAESETAVDSEIQPYLEAETVVDSQIYPSLEAEPFVGPTDQTSLKAETAVESPTETSLKGEMTSAMWFDVIGAVSATIGFLLVAYVEKFVYKIVAFLMFAGGLAAIFGSEYFFQEQSKVEGWLNGSLNVSMEDISSTLAYHGRNVSSTMGDTRLAAEAWLAERKERQDWTWFDIGGIFTGVISLMFFWKGHKFAGCFSLILCALTRVPNIDEWMQFIWRKVNEMFIKPSPKKLELEDLLNQF